MFFNIHEEQLFKFKFVKPFLVKSFLYTKKEHQAILFQSQLSKQTNKQKTWKNTLHSPTQILIMPAPILEI